MSETIYKYPIEITDFQEIPMPSGAQILCVQTQHGMPCLWARVNAGNMSQRRRIHIYGTGHEINESFLRYVGTFQLTRGDLVFHVFDGGVH